ncbi:MAG: hypothetical protein ACP5VQ_07955 [Phycisphaerae bacterium]
MSQQILTLDPASFVPVHEKEPTVGLLHSVLWLLILFSALGILAANWIVQFYYLPYAPIADYGFAGALNLELHLLACVVAGIAVGIAPKAKPAIILSILIPKPA